MKLDTCKVYWSEKQELSICAHLPSHPSLLMDFGQDGKPIGSRSKEMPHF
jgi:hypothetical protein